MEDVGIWEIQDPHKSAEDRVDFNPSVPGRIVLPVGVCPKIHLLSSS